MKRNLSYLILCMTLLFASCAKDKHVCEVVIIQTQVNMNVGETFTLDSEVTVTGKVSELGVDWSSNNTAIATVSSTGEVTAVAEGAAVITATAKADAGKSAVCFIKVQNRD